MGITKQDGFSLIELVLVIAIIMVLSLVSGPLYRNHANKARQAEGYALLGTIRAAQERYFGEFGNFLYELNSSSGQSRTPVGYEEVLGIDARMNKYYKTFRVGAWAAVKSEVGDQAKYDELASSVMTQTAFAAIAYGSEGAANLVMIYNRTVGVEIFIKGGEGHENIAF